MSTWRRCLQQIGGRNAVSIWSWIITIPLALIVSSTYRPNVSPREILTWVGIVLAVHVFLGALMWIASKTILPNTNRPSRLVTAIGFFALLGLIRALLLQYAQDTIGISDGVFSGRLSVNVIGSVVALSAIAIVVDDYRTDTAIVRRLERARATLTRIRDTEGATLRAADLDVLAQVQAKVEAELSEAGADASKIRGIADNIVRPISHELARSNLEVLSVNGEADDPGSRLTFADAFGRLKAPSALAVAIIVEATILGAVILRFGPLTALSNLVLGGALIFTGCWLVARFLPVTGPPVVHLLVLVLALAGVGAAAAALTGFILAPIASTFPAGMIGVAGGVAGSGVALSMWAAVNAGRQARQEALAAAVSEEAAEVERLRGVIEQRRLQAARFLHGAIQGELIAAAMRAENPDLLRDTVSRRFAEYGVLSQRRAEQQVRDVLDAWATILRITFAVDPDCWNVLDSRPDRTELLVDALSEGLTNAVRHASGSAVDVCIARTVDGVTVQVVSEGAPSSLGEPGIGLSQLRARGALISLEAHEDRTEFAAAV